ncbi:MAG: hypothetical protein OH319_03890 [Candidatus Parvarchaeota archaeon]|nr:hypothetical protein [Candidatus Jingweiarchaeum tengchongense]MCW1298073.1 hypothetical protein [Candidatus Jingweiarchaeum tengchongense]MCW1300127.1 hypothetical protein [Candidatus Jingweiarchaeum tengchongense]MCW1309623.1 hypothetical protein [Candidatus Jingweiarchaeum tengchongense]MCW1310889.1 hypothetical protein [Candidatus Jingweiarchaeum tengchongense]
MEEWHEVWSAREPPLVKILLKYVIPIGAVLFFIYLNYHIYVNVLPRASVYGGFPGITIRYIAVLLVLISIAFICRNGLRQQIKIYKEGIWLNSTEFDFYFFKLKTKWTRPEKWIKWEDVKGLIIRSRVKFERVDILYIDVITKNGTYPVVLRIEDAINMKDAIIKEGYGEKLKNKI